MFYDNLLYLDSIKKNSERFLNWNRLKNKKILITGGTGLICSYLADMILMTSEMLHLNISVLIMGRSEEKCKERFTKWWGNDYFSFIKQDLSEVIKPEDLAEKIKTALASEDSSIHYVIHGASNAYPAVYESDPVGTMKGNILGTDALLQYGVKEGIEGFLFLSSGEIYGERDREAGVDEKFCGYTDYLSPRSCYPVAKMASETLCASYTKQFGLRTSVARLCHVYGPTMTKNDNRVINQFLRNVLAGQDIVMKSSGSKVRSYCYVADAAVALLEIMINGESGEAYNVAYSESVNSIKEIAEIAAKLAGKKVIVSQEGQAGETKIEKSVLEGKKLEGLGFRGAYNMSDGLKECYGILRRW